MTYQLKQMHLAINETHANVVQTNYTYKIFH